MTNNKKKDLYIIINNHFDPMWRRCFHKGIQFKGDTYVSYGDLEEYYILDNLDLARNNPGYKFQIESVIVIREFLKRHPELYEELTGLAREGRVYTPGSGEAIIDVNMVLGESIVRNYLIGMLWLEDNFGYRPKLAVRTDAFGNSAQLPQILKGCGIEWVTGFHYSTPKGKYWRGLDGSIVLHHTLPEVGYGGGWRKYAPCPVCKGEKKINDTECGYCKGRGIDRIKAERDWEPVNIDESAFGEYDCGFVTVGGEELLPNPGLIEWAEKAQGEYNAVFAAEEKAYTRMEGLLHNIPAPDSTLLHDELELNPNNTGCFVTRIKTKQNCRRQEYALFKAEALCTLGELAGFKYPKASINEIWQKLIFTMFHDAITGTHVDEAYRELESYWKEIDMGTSEIYRALENEIVEAEDGSFSIINLSGNNITDYFRLQSRKPLTGMKIIDEAGEELNILECRKLEEDLNEAVVLVKGLPQYSSKIIRLSNENNEKETPHNAQNREYIVLSDLLKGEKAKGVQSVIFQGTEYNGPGLKHPDVSAETRYFIENRRFLVTADIMGITSIYDKMLERYISMSDDYRPGEFIIEHDEGSPWATLSTDMNRTGLSKHTELAAVEKTQGMQRFFFEVKVPQQCAYAIDAIKIKYSVTLWEGIDRLEFKTDVKWDGYNHRLRVAFPVTFTGSYQYEIPYGVLNRKPYKPTFNWIGANGDWPAINWAGIEGEKTSVAILNKGTPSYKMETGSSGNDIILLSVLRSPALPTYLHEPDAYTMNEWDGMRDAGDHSFEYAIKAYDKPFADSNVILDADNYNTGLHVVSGKVSLPEMPEVKSENVRISSIKIAERSNSLIMRLVEFRGRDGSVVIRLPDNIRGVSRANMLEDRTEQLEVINNTAVLSFRPFEIFTLSMDIKNIGE